MGSRIAVRLSGLAPVCAWNRTSEKAKRLSSQHSYISTAEEIAELGKLPIIVTSLADDAALEKVILHDLRPWLRKDTVIMDTSTVSPRTAQKIAGALKADGVLFLDTPVSGGSSAAINGTLIAMVGGETQVFELDTVQAVLRHLCKNYVHCGPSGSGQQLKLINQILVAGTSLAVANTLAAARQLGLDEGLTVDILSQGYGQSRLLSELGPLMAANQTDSGFKLSLLEKDLKLLATLLSERQLALDGVGHALRVIKHAVALSGKAAALPALFRACVHRLHHGG
jgi:3-hydroxyisobutyrate dehydrogenase